MNWDEDEGIERSVNILGQKFRLKTMGCNVGHTRGKPIPPMVSLYVKTTNACNAHCLFCSNEALSEKRQGCGQNFDIDAFFEAVDAILTHDGLLLGSIRFTGGEPSMVAESVVLPVLDHLSQEPYQGIYLHLNTNALLPQAWGLMQHPRWNSISVSLHHYDRQLLAKIYGAKVPESFTLASLRRKGLRLNVSCNLIRGYIDTADKAHCMMDYALDIGADALGFVSLMQVNDYCKQQYVDYNEIQWKDIPSLYFSCSMNRGSICHCADYLYNSKGRALQVYMRNNLDPSYCESSLTFSGNRLYQGFSDSSAM